MMKLHVIAVSTALSMGISAGPAKAASVDYTLTDLGSTRYEEAFYPKDISFGRSSTAIFDIIFNEFTTNLTIVSVTGTNVAEDAFSIPNPMRPVAQVSFFTNFGTLTSLKIHLTYKIPLNGSALPPAPLYDLYNLNSASAYSSDYANLVSYTPFQASTGTSNSVPEPASLLVLSAAAAGMMASRKRHR